MMVLATLRFQQMRRVTMLSAESAQRFRGSSAESLSVLDHESVEGDPLGVSMAQEGQLDSLPQQPHSRWLKDAVR